MIRMFVFDYGRTLYDREHDTFFKDAETVLKILLLKYRLAIVSYSKSSEIREREKALADSGLYDLFDDIVFTDTPEGKDDAYLRLSEATGVSTDELAIVDDHIIRGVAWGNRNGATTYWLKKGKFSDVLPTKETGLPTYTITSLSDIPGTLES